MEGAAAIHARRPSLDVYRMYHRIVGFLVAHAASFPSSALVKASASQAGWSGPHATGRGPARRTPAAPCPIRSFLAATTCGAATDCHGRVTPARRTQTTFRFSGERPRPHESTRVHLIRPDDLLGHPGVQDRPHVSTTVVSTALAADLCIRWSLTFRSPSGESECPQATAQHPRRPVVMAR